MIVQLCLSYICIWILLIFTNSFLWHHIHLTERSTVDAYVKKGTMIGKLFQFTTYMTLGLFIVIPLIIIALIFGW